MSSTTREVVMPFIIKILPDSLIGITGSDTVHFLKSWESAKIMSHLGTQAVIGTHWKQNWLEGNGLEKKRGILHETGSEIW